MHMAYSDPDKYNQLLTTSKYYIFGIKFSEDLRFIESVEPAGKQIEDDDHIPTVFSSSFS